jgi:hypothetical protein
MTDTSKSKEREIFDQLVETKVGEIRKYRNLLLSLVACYGYFGKKKDYKCYLGAQIGDKAPDVIVKSQIQSKVDIVGDGKKGLPAPRQKAPDESWDQYKASQDVIIYMDKMLKEVTEDITKYACKLDTITEPHDFFMLCPTEKRTAIKLLERDNKLDSKAIILSYDFSNDETRYVLRVVKENGKFSDEDINNDFELNGGITHHMQDYAELMSKYKLYLAEKEDCNAPIEWIMLVIWQYILPEIAQTNQKDTIIAQLNEGCATITVNLKQVSDFIKQNYKLPTYNGDKELISLGIIRKAMENLKLLTDVQVIEGENTPDPKFKVIWKKIPSQNLLHEFVKKIHEKEFERLAKAQASTPEKPDNQKSITEF